MIAVLLSSMCCKCIELLGENSLAETYSYIHVSKVLLYSASSDGLNHRAISSCADCSTHTAPLVHSIIQAACSSVRCRYCSGHPPLWSRCHG